ncbi:MAG: FMN adenylyltransferase / Riboflavin kinase [uncultured Corynebacteriales bacterium]|uniref:Riboflavin biosynthesis protein n=1 Tax=uncultured Mycobacteriales bacterium TaxID=581187 RepID=A0A6J4HY06_9ACTN|nr:MAG: FMN adenylyltransferase / Riboflavin kinase [uncultured Corynebacteriales bacterium]
MLRWRGLDSTPSGWGRCVVSIGVFDGVHRGHQQLIGRAVQRARATGLPSVVLTFDPHPSEVVRPGSHPPVLSPVRRKADLVEELGVDVFCVLPFSTEFSRLAPDEFVHVVLVEKLHAAAVVVGENFRFGHRAAGDLDELRTLGRKFGFSTEGVPMLRDDDVTLSSTFVRSSIDAGEVGQAAQVLGRPHRIDGIVVRGEGRGRQLGYPTANVHSDKHVAVPADGVYAGWAVLRGDRLPAAISVGTNPTFEGRKRTVEAFILDFDQDIYGVELGVEFVERIRGMEKFDSVEELVEQMGRDVEKARGLLH